MLWTLLKLLESSIQEIINIYEKKAFKSVRGKKRRSTDCVRRKVVIEQLGVNIQIIKNMHLTMS